MSQKVTVWDFAVRFFHWSQVMLLAGLWYTGEEGLMAQHQLLAYTLLALVITRLCWGFVGSQTARFSQFTATPARAIRYLRRPAAVTGHNAASFYMIVLLLLLTMIQLLSGLATFDNSYTSDGPLVTMLPAAWVELASAVHSLNINILLALIGVHIVAALWHSLKVHNVIWIMLSGKDDLIEQQALRMQHSGWFFLLFAVLSGLLYLWQGKTLIALL